MHEARRAADRDRKRLERRRVVGEGRAFGLWLRYVVAEIDETESAWSNRLAKAMQRSPEYDAALREIAKKDDIRPHRKTTYEIGEGLRECGLAWCSGTYALLQHPREHVVAYAILDLVAREDADSFRLCFEWLRVARFAGQIETRVRDEEGPDWGVVLSTPRQVLGEKSAQLTVRFDRSFHEYTRRGLRTVESFFGLYHDVATNPRYQPVAFEATALIRAAIAERLAQTKDSRPPPPPASPEFDAITERLCSTQAGREIYLGSMQALVHLFNEFTPFSKEFTL